MDNTGTTEKIRAHGAVVKKLGHWTSARLIDVKASAANVVLELRSPEIAAGDIEVGLDANRSVVKLLVPDDAIIDDGELRRIGRGRVKDMTGSPSPAGRRIVLTGELRNAEVRVHRGGIATLSAMATREYFADALNSRRAGRYPTIDDPSRSAVGDEHIEGASR